MLKQYAGWMCVFSMMCLSGCGDSGKPIDARLSDPIAIDSSHQHRHLHGELSDHDHGHEGFLGAHSHEHAHGHRHPSGPSNGEMFDVELSDTKFNGRWRIDDADRTVSIADAALNSLDGLHVEVSISETVQTQLKSGEHSVDSSSGCVLRFWIPRPLQDDEAPKISVDFRAEDQPAHRDWMRARPDVDLFGLQCESGGKLTRIEAVYDPTVDGYVVRDTDGIAWNDFEERELVVLHSPKLSQFGIDHFRCPVAF